MAKTKAQLAADRQRLRLKKRVAGYEAEGFAVLECEFHTEVQCMTCGVHWRRLTPFRMIQHRQVCPPDPALARFIEPDPQPSALPRPLPLRHKPW